MVSRVLRPHYARGATRTGRYYVEQVIGEVTGDEMGALNMVFFDGGLGFLAGTEGCASFLQPHLQLQSVKRDAMTAARHDSRKPRAALPFIVFSQRPTRCRTRIARTRPSITAQSLQGFLAPPPGKALPAVSAKTTQKSAALRTALAPAPPFIFLHGIGSGVSSPRLASPAWAPLCVQRTRTRRRRG